MAYYSIYDTTGNGSQTNFAFSFGYIVKSHIHAYVGGVENTTFTWVNNSTIQISPAPGNGVAVRIQRRTPIDNLLVDFVNGSVMGETDLDNSNLQNLYAEQEAADAVQASLQLATDGKYDATNKVIKNVADPTSIQDAATKSYVDSAFAASPGGHALVAHNDVAAGIDPTAGDILVANNGAPNKWDTFPIGANNDILSVNTANPTKLSWGSIAAKLLQLLTTQGDLAVSSGSAVARFAKGVNGDVLETQSAETYGLKWTSLAAKLLQMLTTKGDLLVSTGATTQRKAAGANGLYLMADSAQGDGLSWSSLFKTRSVTATDTATIDDKTLVLSGASFTETLYTAVGNAGRHLVIKHAGTSLTQVYTIDGNGAETIDGTTTYILYTNGETLELVSDGANWLVVSHRAQTPLIDAGTMTINGTTTNPTKASSPNRDSVYWKRDGDMVDVIFVYHKDGAATGAAAGAGDYIFVLPTNIAIDTTIHPGSTLTTGNLNFYTLAVGLPGVSRLRVDGVADRLCSVAVYNSTGLRLVDSSSGMVGAGNFQLTNSNMAYYIAVRFKSSTFRA